MNQTSRYAASLLLFVGLSLHAQPSANQLEDALSVPGVNVRIFNYAGVKRGVFSKAQQEASRILRRSGVETRWIECAAPSPGAKSDPRCTSKTKPTDLVIRILAKEMTDFKHHGEFGVALLPAHGGFGQRASVFYNRARDYANRWQGSEGSLLGHLIAHEIGHLLLGANSHSGSGVMSLRWTRNTIARASLGVLLFTEREAREMRAQVAQRVRLAAGPTDSAETIRLDSR